MIYDVAIIGGGIVGLATAHRVQEQYRNARVIVLEKEARLASHQTGRNSGVLHAGVYYRPGSNKAAFCRKGKQTMEAFCDAERISYNTCGKTIVAATDSELPRLEALYDRATANGVRIERVDRERLGEIEPFSAGVAALHVPETGVVDFGVVARRLAQLVEERGGEIRLNARVLEGADRSNSSVINTAGDAVEARVVVNCAGLWADRIAGLFGVRPAVQLVPFRGEYVELSESARRYCRGLIYPVPNPGIPFLGIHLTRMVDGRVEAGPSAALAFAREGYTLGTISPHEVAEVFRYRGFRKLARRHWRMGLTEMLRSVSKRAFLTALQRLVPDLTPKDLLSCPAGVRAQAVYKDGTLADDFIIETTPRAVHVINAPSPAATASLAIGEHVARLAIARLA